MNNCSQAPQTDATRAAADAYLESWGRDGMDWDAWVAEVERARQSFARLINADVDEVAVTSSVSQAASAFASALSFDGARRRVLASAAEFPTVGHVWLAQHSRGAEVHWAPLSNRRHDRHRRVRGQDRRTHRVVSACHAYYLNGFKHDIGAIARIARARGALTFVDAYQTLGTEPIDVKALGIDALAGGTLKYLMAIAGIAFLYVRRGLAEELRPTVTGWFGRVNPFAFDATALDWAPGARRFDGGTPPIINAYVARAGLEIIHEVGPARVGRMDARAVGTAGERRRGARLVLHGDIERGRQGTDYGVLGRKRLRNRRATHARAGDHSVGARRSDPAGAALLFDAR
jgi:selenocysteine lyase/cysteine desulfurase